MPAYMHFLLLQSAVLSQIVVMRPTYFYHEWSDGKLLKFILRVTTLTGRIPTHKDIDHRAHFLIWAVPVLF